MPRNEKLHGWTYFMFYCDLTLILKINDCLIIFCEFDRYVKER